MCVTTTGSFHTPGLTVRPRVLIVSNVITAQKTFVLCKLGLCGAAAQKAI